MWAHLDDFLHAPSQDTQAESLAELRRGSFSLGIAGNEGTRGLLRKILSLTCFLWLLLAVSVLQKRPNAF